MAEYKIKVVTSSDVSGITKTTDAIGKLTAATKENAKSAKESASVFNDLLKSRANSSDQAAYVSGLTKEAKEQRGVNETVKETVGIKGKWSAALKQLKNDIPGLGIALNALKNPFTAVIAIIATMLNWLQQVNEEIKEFQDIVGKGKIAEQFNNIATALAASTTRAKEFKRALKEITDRPESVQEQTQRMLAQADLNLKVQEAQDEQAKTQELAGVADPAARAAIESKFEGRAKKRVQARLDVAANVAAQGQFRSRDIVRANEARLPEMNDRLFEAQIDRDAMVGLAEDHTTSPEKLAALDDQIERMKNPGMMDMIRIQATYGSPAAAAAALRAKMDARASLVSQNSMSTKLRAGAEDELGAEQARFTAFQSQTTGAAEDARNFGIQRGIAAPTADALRPFNDPGASAADQANREAQAKFDRFLNSVLLILNDKQQAVDAISRRNASASQNNTR